MDIDNGGWTLFLNYVHTAGSSVTLNSNKIPSEPKASSNSHVLLDSMGFQSKDVRQLRFLCTEVFQGKTNYWHFLTSSEDIIAVAMDGDQTAFTRSTANPLSSKYVELPPLKKFANYDRAISDATIKKFQFGSDPKGGLLFRPFGSSYNGGGFWSIKGTDSKQDIFECGSIHQAGDYSNTDSNPTNVVTHHTIWFRGEPLSEDEARKRLLNKLHLN